VLLLLCVARKEEQEEGHGIAFFFFFFVLWNCCSTATLLHGAERLQRCSKLRTPESSKACCNASFEACCSELAATSSELRRGPEERRSLLQQAPSSGELQSLLLGACYSKLRALELSKLRALSSGAQQAPSSGEVRSSAEAASCSKLRAPESSGACCSELATASSELWS